MSRHYTYLRFFSFTFERRRATSPLELVAIIPTPYPPTPDSPPKPHQYLPNAAHHPTQYIIHSTHHPPNTSSTQNIIVTPKLLYSIKATTYSSSPNSLPNPSSHSIISPSPPPSSYPPISPLHTWILGWRAKGLARTVIKRWTLRSSRATVTSS